MIKKKVRKANSLLVTISSLLMGETKVKAVSSSPLFWLRLIKEEIAGTTKKEVIKTPVKLAQVNFQTAIKMSL